MKRFLTILSICAFTTAAADAAPTEHHAVAPHHAVKKTPGKPVVPKVVHLKYKVAPADEYFGRMKMSILGIRNSLKDMGLKADADPAHAASIMGTVALTADAMRDWERKYPHDSWIPGTILTLERVYAKVDSDDARALAKRTMAWLVHDYPATQQGRIGKSELAANRVGVKPSPPPADPVAPALDTAVTDPK